MVIIYFIFPLSQTHCSSLFSLVPPNILRRVHPQAILTHHQRLPHFYSAKYEKYPNSATSSDSWCRLTFWEPTPVCRFSPHTFPFRLCRAHSTRLSSVSAKPSLRSHRTANRAPRTRQSVSGRSQTRIYPPIHYGCVGVVRKKDQKTFTLEMWAYLWINNCNEDSFVRLIFRLGKVWKIRRRPNSISKAFLGLSIIVRDFRGAVPWCALFLSTASYHTWSLCPLRERESAENVQREFYNGLWCDSCCGKIGK